MCQTLAWALLDACATQEAGTSRKTGVQKGLQGARRCGAGGGAGVGAEVSAEVLTGLVGQWGGAHGAGRELGGARRCAQTKGWHIQENRWKWRGDKKRRKEMWDARKRKGLAHQGKPVEMERRQEEKRGNEEGQKEKRLAHPGKPLELERRQEMREARAGATNLGAKEPRT